MWQIGWMSIVLGVIAVALAVLADPLEIGGSGGFGWKQALLLVAGAVLVVVGAVVARRAHRTEGRPE